GMKSLTRSHRSSVSSHDLIPLPAARFISSSSALPYLRISSKYAGFGYEINPPSNKSARICLNHSPHLANFFINATSLKFPVFRAKATVLTVISDTP
ncbi:MAG: hypothetical protein LBP81_03575, partial [Treponema sp.]|nr:hypothetical protein [Treponema sp.]